MIANKFNIDEIIDSLPINYKLIKKNFLQEVVPSENIEVIGKSDGYGGTIKLHQLYKPISKLK